jgi:methionyl aminopeptidase
LLADGDLVGIDVGVEFQGYIADAARTFLIGPAPEPLAIKLSATARQALERAMEAARPGNRVADLSRAIQMTAEAAGFSVVRQLCGHGVGKALHEDPEIPNFHKAGLTPLLKPGMVLAIEPMVNAGGWQVDFLPDGWTVVTADGSLSAHFEDTVVVTQDQPLVATR